MLSRYAQGDLPGILSIDHQVEGCSGKMVVSDVFRPVIAVGTFSTGNDPAFQSIHNFLITVDVTVDN